MEERKSIEFRGIKAQTTVLVADREVPVPILGEILKAWFEAGRESYESTFENLSQDDRPHRASIRRAYICLDIDGSGVLMVDRSDGRVYGIKGYGNVHKGHYYGNLLDITKDGGPRWFWRKGDWYGKSANVGESIYDKHEHNFEHSSPGLARCACGDVPLRADGEGGGPDHPRSPGRTRRRARLHQPPPSQAVVQIKVYSMLFCC